ncbi:hypothetical protein TrVGV298_001775 [Trichoderma virens]|nr:hypothetical protein TrVGV298_001775 [Trichoderma virens]
MGLWLAQDIGRTPSKASLTSKDVSSTKMAKHGTELRKLDLTLPETVNRACFVQSLATQRNLGDGVYIDDTVRDVVSGHVDGISFTSDIHTFVQAPAVQAVFSELGRRFRGVEEARNHLRRAQAGIKVLRNVKIPTRDGRHLLADVLHPNKAGRYPVLMRLRIYGRAFRIGAIFDDADRETSEKREDAWFQGDRQHLHPYWRFSDNAASACPSVWVSRGYIVALVDGRGVGNVPGKLNPYSKQKTRDYYDAIEWAAKQPWSDGNIGRYWRLIQRNDPVAYGDIRDLSYPGGIFLEATADKYYQGEGALSANFPSIDIPVLAAVRMASTIHPRSGFEASSLSSRVKKLMDAVYPGYMYKGFQPDLEAFCDQ